MRGRDIGYRPGMSDPNRPPEVGRPTPDAPAGPAADPGAPPATSPRTGPEAATGPDPLRGSRTSGLWLTVTALGLVLLLLVVFIAQNTQSVEVSFLGWNGQAPLAVALLVAAVAGLFLALVAGGLRIWQLRRRVRRDPDR